MPPFKIVSHAFRKMTDAIPPDGRIPHENEKYIKSFVESVNILFKIWYSTTFILTLQVKIGERRRADGGISLYDI